MSYGSRTVWDLKMYVRVNKEDCWDVRPNPGQKPYSIESESV